MRTAGAHARARSRTFALLGVRVHFMGDDPGKRSDEIDALRGGARRGLTLVDTAEMYGNGRAELLVGEATADCRDDVFLVSEVSPGANRDQTVAACAKSLERLAPIISICTCSTGHPRSHLKNRSKRFIICSPTV